MHIKLQTMPGGIVMPKLCPVGHIADEMNALLRLLSERTELDADQDKRLRELIVEWDSILCEQGCDAKFCSFLRPYDWVTYLGYRHLYEVIGPLPRDDETALAVKPRKSFDALRASWAKRDGHYNP